MSPKKSSAKSEKPNSTSRKRATGPAAGSTPEFSPTLGDIDVHLFAEGRHERIYEKLGSHCLTHEGKRGVSFAVWAPNANRVSVVGNFNRWDSSQHQMRPLGSSGVWETFIPGLRAGELYKYAIRRGHHEFFKADPYASLMEAPPETSSIVFKSTHKFRDRGSVARSDTRTTRCERCVDPVE